MTTISMPSCCNFFLGGWLNDRLSGRTDYRRRVCLRCRVKVLVCNDGLGSGYFRRNRTDRCCFRRRNGAVSSGLADFGARSVARID